VFRPICLCLFDSYSISCVAHTAIKREGVSDEEPEHVFIRTQTVKKQEYGAEVGRYRWREMTSASQESQKLATSGKTKPGSELFTLDLKTEELTVQSLSQESGRSTSYRVATSVSQTCLLGKSNRKRTSSTKTQQFISATSTANAGAYPMQQTGSLRLGPAIQHPWTSGTGESYPQQHMPYDPSFAFTSTFPTGPDVQKPSEPKRSHNKRKGGDHVARPPNAFLLFRRDFILNKRVPGIVEGDGKNLSVIAGAVWKNMGANEQARWYGLAKIVSLHQVSTLLLAASLTYPRRKRNIRESILIMFIGPTTSGLLQPLELGVNGPQLLLLPPILKMSRPPNPQPPPPGQRCYRRRKPIDSPILARLLRKHTRDNAWIE
jgi:hypothetical protein